MTRNVIPSYFNTVFIFTYNKNINVQQTYGSVSVVSGENCKEAIPACLKVPFWPEETDNLKDLQSDYWTC
jgi:hypothetical protein